MFDFIALWQCIRPAADAVSWHGIQSLIKRAHKRAETAERLANAMRRGALYSR